MAPLRCRWWCGRRGACARPRRRSRMSEGRRVPELSPDLSLRLDRGLDEAELLADLRHLSWRQRVIVVKLIAGFSPDEIAVGLGCGRATVYREIERLRPLLSGYQ